MPARKHKEDDHGQGRHNQLTEYLVDLGHGRSVCLRGMSDDLQAITATAWLRNKTFVEGYLEAMAKVLVYLVAAFSGNITQAGSIIMMSLLLVTAGLLALSNAHAKSLRNNGRVVSPTTPVPSRRGTVDDPPYPGGDHSTTSWPGSSGASGMTGMDDWAEKGQIGHALQHHGPFDGGVDYR
ncbi:hypothetical protein UCRPA7_8579 [Phaeoacremonium minimum UCRPA7]|uniref:Uncharacterized protein n=1 Tax=Phaeoacremonium minimum (strain UCR-PA7) TaxID=1286976 RepID=R8B9I4_PHAM7|nr:hypothetical protein UCRPA7_8579 [Phaeoacremonium minimum UCRPA7]EON95942.1 hypothetical protein UCRPA7_8579 [Phaeoacremonium minimum UCRPA7]